MQNIENIIEELDRMDSAAFQDQLTIPSVDIRSQNEEIVISGNRSGLRHLALQLLRISTSEFIGAHYHLDEASIADVAETNVVFSLSQLT